MRAMLSQGVRLQPQDYRWFCQMKLAMNDINKRAIRNTWFRGPAKKGFGANAVTRKDLKEYSDRCA